MQLMIFLTIVPVIETVSNVPVFGTTILENFNNFHPKKSTNSKGIGLALIGVLILNIISLPITLISCCNSCLFAILTFIILLFSISLNFAILLIIKLIFFLVFDVISTFPGI